MTAKYDILKTHYRYTPKKGKPYRRFFKPASFIFIKRHFSVAIFGYIFIGKLSLDSIEITFFIFLFRLLNLFPGNDNWAEPGTFISLCKVPPYWLKSPIWTLSLSTLMSEHVSIVWTYHHCPRSSASSKCVQ